jgi:hypothetical protein
MRLKPTEPELLSHGGGKRIQVWTGTHARLKQLAKIERKDMAVIVDELITAALERALTRAEKAAKKQSLDPT